jgi:hypothetical protein
MTLDEFLLVIYEMGYGHPMGGVSVTALEENFGAGYVSLFDKANAEGYLEKAIGQLWLTSSGKDRVGRFQ